MKPVRNILLTVATAALSLTGFSSPASHLIINPWPKVVEEHSGSFTVSDSTRIFVPPTLARSEFLAVDRLQHAFWDMASIRPRLDRLGASTSDAKSNIVLSIKAPAVADARLADGYELTVSADGVNLVGNSESGLFYGLQSLIQLVEQHGAELPHVTLRDEPDFRWRGYYQDISRGRVPTLETLEWTVDYLASQKVNMFQLYVEHPFAFRFNPAIAHNGDGLTSEDVLRLDQYCRDRRILFVPSLQSFGHMAGVLSVPEYCDLADKTVTKTWEEMTWNDRMHGATINPKDPKALALLEKMHGEFLPLFEAPFINVCADETYDLGEGKTAEEAKAIGKGQLYLDHILWLNELSKKHGKRMMFWGDIVKKHPELIPQIPKDTILLNWGYSPKTDFESCKLFQDAGLDFFVCPGVSGWSRILAEITAADLNIRRYAAAGKKYGAMGLLNTDWGDHGNYNQQSGSLYGIALGAAVAWNVDTPDETHFDRVFAARTFSKGGDEVIAHWRRTVSVAPGAGSWEVMYTPIQSKPRWAGVPHEKGSELTREAEALADALQRSQPREAWVKTELLHSARMLALLGRKQTLAGELEKDPANRDAKLPQELEKLASEIEIKGAEFENVWLMRNRESDLSDIRKVLAKMVANMRDRAHGGPPPATPAAK